jgi:hypothetical protein
VEIKYVYPLGSSLIHLSKILITVSTILIQLMNFAVFAVNGSTCACKVLMFPMEHSIALQKFKSFSFITYGSSAISKIPKQWIFTKRNTFHLKANTYPFQFLDGALIKQVHSV